MQAIFYTVLRLWTFRELSGRSTLERLTEAVHNLARLRYPAIAKQHAVKLHWYELQQMTHSGLANGFLQYILLSIPLACPSSGSMVGENLQPL
jgi:hypothetical protein